MYPLRARPALVRDAIHLGTDRCRGRSSDWPLSRLNGLLLIDDLKLIPERADTLEKAKVRLRDSWGRVLAT